VVLDDTASTGNSIEGARQLLLNAGAVRVAGVALGRTVKYL
jgi:predicted amidophosphoribosyltransferase